MKYFIAALILVLAGCGKGGSPSNDPSGVPSGTDPSCKNLYSIWQSDNDLERFDFTSLAYGSVNNTYSFKASNGATCGYPYNSLTAEMTTEVSSSTWDYTLSLTSNVAMSGTCAEYVPSGSVGNKYAQAFITMTACNDLTICRGQNSDPSLDCKLFH